MRGILMPLCIWFLWYWREYCARGYKLSQDEKKNMHHLKTKSTVLRRRLKIYVWIGVNLCLTKKEVLEDG